MLKAITLLMTLMWTPGFAQEKISNTRPRALDVGLKVGILPVGPLNGITDVTGVEVGQTTIIRGDNIEPA
jgi:D-aminopeptidase